MTDPMIALVTCPTREEAGKIAETLVAEALAACVNIVGSVESCYRWEGKLNWDHEYLLLIKTMAQRIEEVRDRVLELHSYDVPEFIAVRITSGSSRYLKWMEESVSRSPTS